MTLIWTLYTIDYNELYFPHWVVDTRFVISTKHYIYFHYLYTYIHLADL